MQGTQRALLATTSPELHTKSSRTRRRFRAQLVANLEAALARHAPGAGVVDDGRRLWLEAPDHDAAVAAAARVFGLQRVDAVVGFAEPSFDELVDRAAEIAAPRVTGRTFAVRVRRRGGQRWSTQEAQRRIGAALFDVSAGVNLDAPEVEVRVEAWGDRAWVVEQTWPGPGGLPLGTQSGALALLSGGFDSPVASWLLMRRGVPVDFVHFTLDCSVSDHALLVARDLWHRWGMGASPLAWLVDFEAVKAALLEHAPPRLRQVLLKEYMFAAADALAAGTDRAALITGEAVGQVSSQTLHHLAAIDRACHRTVLRPLAGADKQEIIDRSRAIGVHDLAVRAREVCDLSEGPVAVAAQEETLARARGRLPATLVQEALAHREVIALESWFPGLGGVPVCAAPPEEVPVLEVTDPATEPADEGPLALTGPAAVPVGSRLHAAGRKVWIVEPAPAPQLDTVSAV